ncbi:Putative component of 'biosynthetic module' [Hathewaya proteolytica DSM 3090]|uniref:Putative component of 'biosynthetic module n=1 Tax=Hathewaya proteolytica DSM 3090 TaxID=1121331 RepID=A0A1M6QEU4_9CLOT|nr:YceG family protein [Hathewaya proteolytica]SHK18630.1 Putative component of 'biosynthetic module' [Hathewaya proteolytica DSM 3090]
MKKANEGKLHINSRNLDLSDKVWQDLKTDVRIRKGFALSSSTVTVPTYFYRFIGIKENNEEYFDDILRIDRELRVLGTLYLKVTKGFSRDVSIKIQSSVQNLTKYKGDILFLIQKCKDNGLFSESLGPIILDQITNTLRVVLDYFVRVKGDHVDVIKALSLMVHWINIYIPQLFINYDFDGKNPKVLFYGEISEEEALFLFLLWMLGVDVVFFNTEDDKIFDALDPQCSFSRVVTYSNRCLLKDLPASFNERVNTTAYGAKEEMDKILFNEDTNFYRPWQFTEYSVKNVTLKTTFEEIQIWMREKASLREGWKIKNGTVYIPNVFAKIRGVTEDIEEYFQYIKNIKKYEKNTFINKLPMVNFVTLEYQKFNEVYPTRGNYFDVDRMINSSWWPYSELRTGLQRALGENIRELCLNPVVYNKQNEELRDLQVEIFSVLINSMDTKFMQLLQNFDYPDEVPRIIIYNNEQNGNLSLEDCILLTLMNYMGVDIVIFNPSGYNDIENYVYNELYDVHTLDKMSFNLKLREPKEKKGLFKRLFGV